MYVYVYIFACEFVHEPVCVYAYIYTYICISIYICVYVYIRKYEQASVCSQIYSHTCINIGMFVHFNIMHAAGIGALMAYIKLNMYVNTSMNLYVDICITFFACTFTRLERYVYL